MDKVICKSYKSLNGESKIVIINKNCPYSSKNTNVSRIHLIGHIVDEIISLSITIFRRVLKYIYTPQEIEQNNILIFKQDRLGDLAITIPLLAVLKEKFPNYNIILITSPSNYELAKKIPYVDKIIPLSNKNMCIDYKEMSKITKRISSFYKFMKYDLKDHINVLKYYSNSKYGIDLVGRRRNALIMKILKIKKICGFELSPFSFLYDFKIQYTEDENIILQFLKFLDAFNMHNDDDLNINSLTLNGFKCLKTGKTDKKIAGVHLGFGGEKCRNWGLDNFLALVNRLIDNNYYVKIYYTIHEKNEFEYLYNKLKHENNVKYIFCHNLDIFLQELGDIDVYVGIDGGPSHIVDILGIPNIILFSRENPLKWGSFMSKSTIIKGIIENCENRVCGKNICIKTITPELVFNEIKNIVGEKDE
ncbi:glycosyltransferase family 9 protein [Methanothermococcus sp. Ax23]|uniref:glycosyltransferase family 9 protein n=1 Tax=Methanothermococcus sp. Ax23 TaxID=3156486 RepID=UPI003BA238BE